MENDTDVCLQSYVEPGWTSRAIFDRRLVYRLKRYEARE